MLAKQIKPVGSVQPFRIANNVYQAKTPVLVARTEAELHENGYTYNETGFTYNQAGVTYGGVFGSQDVRPLVSLAQSIHPTIFGAGDFEPTERTVGRGMLIGILGLTYAEDQTFYV